MQRQPIEFCWVAGVLVVATVVSACSAVRSSGTKTGGLSGDPHSPPTNNVWDGVYTLAQAERGEEIYQKQCASCHGRALEGNEHFCGPALADITFWNQWNGTTVGDLYDRIQTTMPENKAGSLDGPESAAIVSFLLKSNDLPSGQKDLPSDMPTLNRIGLTNRKPKR